MNNQNESTMPTADAENRGSWNDVNEVTIIGRLSKEPKIRISENGVSVCNITVASSTGYGKYKRTNFVPVRIIGKQADIVADNLNKGSWIYVKGCFCIDQWKKNDDFHSFTYVLSQKVILNFSTKKAA